MYLISKERIFFYECTRIHYYEKSGKKKKKKVGTLSSGVPRYHCGERTACLWVHLQTNQPSGDQVVLKMILC